MSVCHQAKVVFTTFDFGYGCIGPASAVPGISHSVHCGAWIRELAVDDLDHQHSCLEAVQLLCVNGRVQQSLGRHVGFGSRAHSKIAHSVIKFTHPKIGYLCPYASSDQQHIVTGEITMQDLIVMEEGERLSNVVVDVDLHVIGKAGLG